MIHYIQLFFGLIIGQALMTALNVYQYQKNRQIEYNTALQVYVRAEKGYYVIAIVSIIAALFVLSEFINLSVTKDEIRSLDHKTFKDNLRLYFKTGALVLGLVLQYAAFALRTVGKVAIDKASKVDNDDKSI